jgi:hypothetical protein
VENTHKERNDAAFRKMGEDNPAKRNNPNQKDRYHMLSFI